MKKVGKNIKAARTEKNMTQLELADILGVTFVTVNRWENGKCRPSLKEQKAFFELCKNRGIELTLE